MSLDAQPPATAEQAPSNHASRIALLESLRGLLVQWETKSLPAPRRALVRSRINRLLPSAKQAVLDAGLSTRISLLLPSPAGVARVPIDLLGLPFEQPDGESLIQYVLDRIDQAIGVYENLRDDTGLVRLSAASGLDIVGAIERALRPSFRHAPPASEQAVQDAVEVILNSLGVEFERDREVAPVAAKGFKPDFTVEEFSLAIEIKLATKSHRERAIQEELAADITGYGTKWRRLLAIVYDVGVIRDPGRLRRENMRLFGVTVVVVKH